MTSNVIPVTDAFKYAIEVKTFLHVLTYMTNEQGKALCDLAERYDNQAEVHKIVVTTNASFSLPDGYISFAIVGENGKIMCSGGMDPSGTVST